MHKPVPPVLSNPPFFGRTVTRAAFVIALLGWGLGFYSPPIFIYAVITRTQWPLTWVSSAVTLHFLVGALVVANLPSIYRRVGVARATRLGAIMLALGVIGWAHAQQLWQLAGAALLTGAGWVFLGAAAINAIVSPWFWRKRPTALAFAYNGASIGGVVFAPLWAALIATLGFSSASILVGFALLVIVIPITVWILPHTPASKCQGVDGEPVQPALVDDALNATPIAQTVPIATTAAIAQTVPVATTDAIAQTVPVATTAAKAPTATPVPIVPTAAIAATLPTAAAGPAAATTSSKQQPQAQPLQASLWRDRRFLTLVAAMALGLFAQIGLIAQLYALLATAWGATYAGWTMAMVTACSVAGRTLVGHMIGTTARRRHVAAASYAMQAVGTAILLSIDTNNVALVIVGLVLFGLGIGNATSLPPMVAQQEFDPAMVAPVVARSVAVSQALYAFAPTTFAALLMPVGDLAPRIGHGTTTYFGAVLLVQLLAIAALLSGRPR